LNKEHHIIPSHEAAMEDCVFYSKTFDGFYSEPITLPMNRLTTQGDYNIYGHAETALVPTSQFLAINLRASQQHDLMTSGLQA